MIAVLQRVKRASVTVDGEVVGSCGEGLAILLGVAENDTETDAELLSKKIAKHRIFRDENDKMNLSVIDIDTGRVYGTLSEVNDGVQGKLYTIKTDSGDVIFPGIPQFVKEIDTERGVFIRPIPGFFSEE